MKILCETQLVNRQLPNYKNKSTKATLAIGLHPPGKENAELFIIHFTLKNKTGTRYKLNNNIEKIFTRFVKDGKATISFKLPEHNLLIKCDPIQLKCFLQAMKNGLEGKREMNKIGLSSLATTAIPTRAHPIKSMTITKRGDYPLRGFPKTISSLTITGIGRTAVDKQILDLSNLTTLNLSENSISQVPKELGRLPLISVDFSSNTLNSCEDSSKWDWLELLPIRNTLVELNLSNNKLTRFPYKVVKLNKLLTLKLNNNEIRRIPFAIRRLIKLKFLHMSSNMLESLPQTLTRLRLKTLDVWGNCFRSKLDCNLKNLRLYPVSSLWEIAARNVIEHKMPFCEKSLPWILVDMLTETPLCFCGRLCISTPIFERVALLDLTNVQNLIFNRDQAIYADSVICSLNCAAKHCELLI